MTEAGRAGTQAGAWLALAAVVLLAAAGLRLNPTLVQFPALLWIARFFSFPVVGAVIAWKRPRLPIGWLLLGIGAAIAASLAVEGAARQLFQDDADVGAVVYLAGDQLIKIAFAQIGLLLLLFPDGRLPSPRWRWLLGAIVALLTLGVLGGMVQPGPVQDPSCTVAACAVAGAPDNPLALPFAPLQLIGGGPGFLAFCALLLAAAGSLVVRYRRADVDDRERLKWFTYAAALLATVELVGAAVQLLPPSTVSTLALPYTVAEFLAAVGAAGAIAVAVLRHRLFDIDLVISRTAAYAGLAALVTAFYLGLVVGVGAVVSAGSSSRLLLSILATAAVAVAFQPLRLRLQRAADRLVYGRRATPYEVLASFSARLGQAVSGAELLPGMARVLAEGTGCEAAAVWLERGGAQIAVGAWPPEAPTVEPQAATRTAEISHRGELLGRLAVRRTSGQRLSPTEERLMDDLAHQAGFVLDNVRLQEEVRLRLEELRESRLRLVTVQDSERRRLERDLHDGAQQNLVSLRMKLGLAQAAALEAPAPLRRLLEQMQTELGEALEGVRSLSKGIYPSLLASQGLEGALTARARQVGISVLVQCGPERYPPEIEGAVYFCCAEALQNLAKHSGADHATLRVWAEACSLRFELHDEGRGFTPAAGGGGGLQNMRDRVEALGGELDVRSAPGRGTAVAGRLPLAEARASMPSPADSAPTRAARRPAR